MTIATKTKNWAVVLGFILCTTCTYISLLIGSPLSLINTSIWRAWMDIYKGVFGYLLVCVIAFVKPINVRIYSKHQNMHFKLKSNGLLHSTLSPRAVLTANHQIYSDWLFLWWFSYTAGLESAPVFALKNSLRNVPIIGWAMRSLKFLFLSREWAQDEMNIKNTTSYFAEDPQWPVWMNLFPEGTVFNQSTSAKCQSYAEKQRISKSLVPKHLLLPRVKGIQAILQGLKGTMPVLYDVTIVYEPKAPESVAAEVYYSLGRSFIEGLGPATVKMHIREFPVSQIPYKESEEVFTQWFYERWVEKDRIYAALEAGELESEFRVQAPAQPNSWFALFKCFQMPIALFITLRLVYKLIMHLLS